MQNQFEGFSQAAAAIVREAGRSVVRVEGRGRLSASGFFWAADGHIVTAHHILERESGFRVGLENGQVLSADLIGRDPSTDLALLKIEGADFPIAMTGEVEPEVGNFVFALGRPGQRIQASLGLLSALGDTWRTPAGGAVDRWLQSGVEMLPGFSGGPLVDAGGRVLGLNTSALLRRQAATIPVKTIARVVDSLRAHGKVRQGYLGVGTQPVRLPEALAGELGQGTGLLIVSVEPGSPAEQAGLLLGDVLVGLAGDPIRAPDDLQSALSGDRIGQGSSIKLVRAGQALERKVQLAERK